MQSANDATNIDRFYEAIANMEAQLVAIYQDQSELGIDLGEAKATIESMEGQLFELYREKEQAQGTGTVDLQASLESMEQQLVELYRDQQDRINSQDIISDLESQLSRLELKLQSASGDQTLFETIENLELQLCDLYQERELLMRQPGGEILAKLMSLLQENIELSKQNAQLKVDFAHQHKEIVETKAALKQLSSTILETAFKA